MTPVSGVATDVEKLRKSPSLPFPKVARAAA